MELNNTLYKSYTEVDKGKIAFSNICKKYGIPKSTKSSYIKNRDNMKNVDCQPDRKRPRLVKNEEIEKALFQWFKEARAMSFPVSRPILFSEAEADFKTNSGWIDRFKKQ